MLAFTDILLRLFSALLLGGLIGAEREQRDRPAGLRTHMVVALASATFMVISIDYFRYQDFGTDLSAYRNDPGRIASYVVAGLGFLGAGTIIRGGGGITGLTTASTIWLVSALGLSSGAGMYAVSWLAGVLGLSTLLGLRFVERAIDDHRSHPIRRRLHVTLTDPGQRDEVVRLLERVGIISEDEDLDLEPGRSRLVLVISLRARAANHLVEMVHQVSAVQGVERVALSRFPDPPGNGS